MALSQGWNAGVAADREAMEEYLKSQVMVGHDKKLGLAGGVWNKKGDGGPMEAYFDEHHAVPDDLTFEKKIMDYYESHQYIEPNTTLIVLSTAFTYNQGENASCTISQAILFSEGVTFMIGTLNQALEKAGQKKVSLYNPNKYNNGHPGWCQVYTAMLNRAKATKGFMIQPVGTLAGGTGYRAEGKVFSDTAKGSSTMKGGSQGTEREMAHARGLPVYRADGATWMNNPSGWKGEWIDQFNALKLKLWILQHIKVPANKLEWILQNSCMAWDMAEMCGKGKDANSAWARQYPQVQASKPDVLYP